MESRLRKSLSFLLFAVMIVRLGGEEGSSAVGQGQNNATSNHDNPGKSNETYNDVDVSNKRSSSNEGGGGGVGWGWGGGGGGANGRGGWGWGNGGGGGAYWRWGCNQQGGKRGQRSPKNRVFRDDDYKRGEFAQCMVKGRCKGMRLDCPLHCGGPCFYDCKNICKAHCKR